LGTKTTARTARMAVWVFKILATCVTFASPFNFKKEKRSENVSYSGCFGSRVCVCGSVRLLLSHVKE